MSEREIFIAACQISSARERADFLDQACGHDPQLRQRVLDLLAEQDQLGSFLEVPPLSPTFTEGPTVHSARPLGGLGSQIGPYKLLQVIGEGGMGIVYMAEQLVPVARRVALKIIKPGIDTHQVVARFEAERQALAMMDHPSIAKVLDAGTTTDGLPYFVMELVKGVPITQFCDQQRSSPTERLELFLPVCQAVQHAHQKGIIHRDLKPSNVLVALYDGRPVPKVIDFGVAKATSQRLTEKTMFTEFGQIIGTLEYMSPEQAELSQLDIDTRSDVYSLGVMLYELLTGTTPFERRLRRVALADVLRMIREDEPERPSLRLSTTDQLPLIAANRGVAPQKLSGLVRGELDWIVMKALDKERSRRYDSATGLARDIERYLHDEPVQACPPSTAYRVRKFIRRHRGLVASASLVLFVLTAGIVGTTWGMLRAIDAEARSRREQSATQRALAGETDARRQTRGALESLTDTVVETAFARSESLSEADRLFLQRVLEFFDTYATSTANSPEARRLKAEGSLRVASIQSRLGRLQDAEKASRSAVAVAAALQTEFPQAQEYLELQAQGYARLGQTIAALGRPDEAHAELSRCVELRERLAAEVPENRLNQLRAIEVTLALGDLAKVTKAAAEGLTSDDYFRRALSQLEQLSASDPTDVDCRSRLADAHRRVARTYASTSPAPEVLDHLQSAKAILEALAREQPAVARHRQLLAGVLQDLSLRYLSRGAAAAAEAQQRTAVKLLDQIALERPAEPANQTELAYASLALGELLTQRRDPTAEEELRKAALNAARTAERHSEIPSAQACAARCEFAWGEALRLKGKLDDAESRLKSARQRCMALKAKYSGQDDSLGQTDLLAQCHLALGAISADRLKWDEALAETAIAIRLWQDQSDDTRGWVAPRLALGPKTVIHQASEPPTPIPTGKAWRLADAFDKQAKYLVGAGRPTEALESRRRAVEAITQARPSTKASTLDLPFVYRLSLARLLIELGQANEGKGLLAQLATRLQASEQPSPELCQRCGELGRAWQLAGDVPESLSAHARARELRLALLTDAPHPIDVKELLNVDQAGLTKWISDLPAGFRPVSISSAAHAQPPRFNAIAINDGVSVTYEYVSGVNGRDNRTTHLDDWEKHANHGWRLAMEAAYREVDRTPGERLWIRDGQPWSGDRVAKGEIEQVIAESKRRGLRFVSPNTSPDVPTFRQEFVSYLTAPAAGLDWDFHFGLSAAELIAKVQTAHAADQRLESLQAIADGDGTTYNAVFVSNPAKVAWEFRSELSSTEYAAAAVTLKSQKLRPQCVVSLGDAQQPRYTVVWVGVDLEQLEARRIGKSVAAREYGEAVRELDLLKATSAFRDWMALSPGDLLALTRLAEVLGEQGQWPEAAELLQEVERRGQGHDSQLLVPALVMSKRLPESGEIPVDGLGDLQPQALALFAALANDEVLVRKQVEKAMNMSRLTDLPLLKGMTARTCSLLPTLGFDATAMLPLAQTWADSEQRAPPHELAASLITLSLAHLRLGHFEEAEKALTGSREANPAWSPATVELLRTIIAVRRGSADTARTHLANALRMPPRRFWNSPCEYAEYRLLRQEAETLLTKTGPTQSVK